MFTPYPQDAEKDFSRWEPTLGPLQADGSSGGPTDKMIVNQTPSSGGGGNS